MNQKHDTSAAEQIATTDREHGHEAEESAREQSESAQRENARSDASAPDTSHADSATPQSEQPAAGAALGKSITTRWWLAVLGASVFALPLAWLLGWGGLLPFFLGLFFYALFGLMIGAFAYRLAAPGRPYPPRSLMAGTAALLVVTFGVSTYSEYLSFADNVAGVGMEQKRFLGDREPADFRAQLVTNAREFLSEQYPPGGVIGYIRWAATDGDVSPKDVSGLRRTINNMRQGHIGWTIRVTLAIALLAFGIGSQTLALRHQRESSHRLMDERSES